MNIYRNEKRKQGRVKREYMVDTKVGKESRTIYSIDLSAGRIKVGGERRYETGANPSVFCLIILEFLSFMINTVFSGVSRDISPGLLSIPSVPRCPSFPAGPVAQLE